MLQHAKQSIASDFVHKKEFKVCRKKEKQTLTPRLTHQHYWAFLPSSLGRALGEGRLAAVYSAEFLRVSLIFLALTGLSTGLHDCTTGRSIARVRRIEGGVAGVSANLHVHCTHNEYSDLMNSTVRALKSTHCSCSAHKTNMAMTSRYHNLMRSES